MTRARGDRATRRALRTHAVATLGVTVAIAATLSVVSVVVAADAARSTAEATADTIAHSVVAPLSVIDLDPANHRARTTVLRELDAFIAGGVIDRAKIWRIDGDEAVVLYSDEPRNEGDRRPFDPDLAARLDAGEVVVLPVPDDSEHRFEQRASGLLEAFVGFQDATGQDMRLELYFPSPAPGTLTSLLAVMLPIATLGPLTLGAATLPLARRLARREAERRELLHTALAASDRERRHLASVLHDGVVQDLASVGLTLDQLTLHTDDPAGEAHLARASALIDTDLTRLRHLLTELAPPEFTGSLETALRDLSADFTTTATLVEVHVSGSADADPETAALLYRVSRELIRNSVAHARAGRIRVELRATPGDVSVDVEDDGHGFDPRLPAPEGHLGLSLIRQAVHEHGGTLHVTSSTRGTRARVRLPRAASARVTKMS